MQDEHQNQSEEAKRDRENGAAFVNKLLDDKVKEGEKRAQKDSRYYTDSRINALTKSLAVRIKLAAANQLEVKKQLESLSRRISNGIDLPNLFKRFAITSKIEVIAILLIAFGIYYYFDHVVLTFP